MVEDDRQIEEAKGEAPPDYAAGAPLENLADDPAWRLTAWLLPIGAGASAIITAVQTLGGAIDGALGYPTALVLALLCLALLRDARRRDAARRWVRAEVYEFTLPLILLLAALVLLARGAITASIPALLTLLPVTWEIIHAPAVARGVARMFPYALPVLHDGQVTEPDAPDEVEEIVREVLDRLPPDIAARMEGWTVEVREEMLPRPRDEIVFGCCFTGANVIAIYRRPHVLYHGRGEPLREAVTYTVLHEIAHALGLDETGVRRLGWLR